MSRDYQPRHAKPELPEIFRGLADMIVPLDTEEETQQ